MTNSDPILPIRIYDTVFDQFRFNPHCPGDCCDVAIISDTVNPPMFQFTRESSLWEVQRFLLRRSSQDDGGLVYKLVPQSAVNFVNTTYWGLPIVKTFDFDDGETSFGFSRNVIIKSDCGISNGDLNLVGGDDVTANDGDPILSIPSVESGKKYRLKIIVDHFFQGSLVTPFEIQIHDCYSCAPNILATITSSGVHIIEFTATQSGTLDILFKDLHAGDSFNISYIQLSQIDHIALDGDTELGTDDVEIIQLANGLDVIKFCYSISSYTIDPGDYYYVIETGTSPTDIRQIYYSEIIRFKSLLDLERFYKLTWRNECDLSNILYTGDCAFTNEIYLDSALFGAEYETVADAVQNGNGDQNIMFKRWQKSLKMDIAKSPQHLTDALSGLFLHSTVSLQSPINELKDERDSALELERVTTDIEDVLQNCYQKVVVNFFLPETHVNTSCCSEIELFECGESDPVIELVADSGTLLIPQGTAKPFSTVELYYNLDGAGYITTGETALVQSNGGFIIVWDTATIGVATTLKVKVENKTLLCDYGFSNEVTIV